MRTDIVSNYVTQGINILLRFFLIPIYLSKLGVSAYGIIGFYYSIESIMVLVDFGMGVASAKIIAEQLGEKPRTTIRIIRSIEAFYLLIAGLLGTFIYMLSGYMSQNWLVIDDPSIDGETIIGLMAILLTVSWPKSLYENYLIGRRMILQKNIIVIILSVARALIMIYCIVNLSGGMESYFYVMIFTLFIETFILRLMAYKGIAGNFKFASFSELKPFLKYTSGVGLFSILSLIVFQTDRIFISKFMSTSDLGIYNLSAVIPLTMFSLIYPISSATFPRLVKSNKNKGSFQVYLQSIILLGLICVSFTGLILSNMDFILSLWLKGESNKVNILTAKILLAGTFLHSLTNINANLFLANGKSRVVAFVYAISVISYIIFLSLQSNYTIEIISTGWLVCNAVLLIGMTLSLYFYFNGFFYAFLRKVFQLISVLIIFLLSMVLINHIGISDNGLLVLSLSCFTMLLVLTFVFKEFVFSLFSKIFIKSI